jgi:hypothetical protein
MKWPLLLVSVAEVALPAYEGKKVEGEVAPEEDPLVATPALGGSSAPRLDGVTIGSITGAC